MSLVLCLCISCSPSSREGFFQVTTYNAYLLFDDVDDGYEYDGFRRHDGYDGEAYQERIRELSILLGRRFSSSDVIVLQEVESVDVLADLLSAGLSKKGFRYYGLAADGESVLSVGFVSKHEPSSVAMHSIPGCRPMLEVSFRIRGDTIRIFGVHSRSRLDGGEEERYEMACLLRMLMEDGSGVSIAAGDFNTDPRIPESSMGIYPGDYDPERALHVSSDPSKMRSGVFYAPLLDEDAVLEEEGTYWHQGQWLMYDGFLVSQEGWDGWGWECVSAGISAPLELLDLSGRPVAYDASAGQGYSDHLPATMRLRSTGAAIP